MKALVSIYLWTVGLIYIGLMCTTITLLSFIIPHQKLDPLLKRSLKFVFHLLFIKVKVDGVDKIHPDQTYLFMSNHASLFDVPLLGGYIPKLIRGIEADRQFKWPFYGWLVRRLGNIPISRESIHESIKSIRKAEEYLRMGISMVILPEGHRTKNGELLPFNKLPFYLARQAEVAVVPIGLSGLFTLKAVNSWLIHPRTIKIKFGDIISADQVQTHSVVELRDLVKEKIKSLIEYP
jgi:1-acyl-sn-glycerol-3-phosphate acyltransferase